ncbi:hypothetical protein PS652_01987 [Pseudomonas fluorescens]|uniref:Uncharacterized protein n=1 Tax=Pseudomonas fluorescens TaxID=294 RepID=A0A5E6RL15_PSEFL|nr:hypothetical protein PS652_01511 [Pseudomonas fluorescens]
MSDVNVKCCRCRNQHKESERISVASKWLEGASTMVCPRCRCTSYYRLDDKLPS